MLSNKYFYFQLTRKYVILFGTMFNNIVLKKLNRDVNPPTEIERIKVPLLYGPKEKYITRLHSDPTLNREFQISLPRMSFELRSITYDASRKHISILRNPSDNRSHSQYVGVPYDLTFDLHVYAKNIDDGTHIIEQILPYFNPDYTVTGNMITDMGFLKDVPIILDSVENDVEYEGNFDSVRFVTWRLSFTVKAYYHGYMSTAGLIREVNTNIYNDPTLKSGYITRVNLTNGNSGTYKLNDFVYQGDDYPTANAYGVVIQWSPENNKLMLGATQGQFVIGGVVKAASTNAAFTIASFDESPLQLVNINIVPDPIDALPNAAYGYDTTITEFPNIPSS